MNRYNFYKPSGGIGNLMPQKQFNKPSYNGGGFNSYNNKADFTEDIKLENYSFGNNEFEGGRDRSEGKRITTIQSYRQDNNTTGNNTEVALQTSTPMTRSKPANQPEYMRKLFVGGIPWSLNDDQLKSHFQQWGDVVDCVIIRDRFTKKSRGFGFVTYADIDMVDAAQKCRPHVIEGKSLQSQRAIPKKEANNPEVSSQSKQIVVFGLTESTEESHLVQYFAQFGKVVQIRRPVDDRSGKKKPHAFVYFEDTDVVDSIVLRHHHNINGCKAEARKSVPRRVMQQVREYRRFDGHNRPELPWDYRERRALEFGSGYDGGEGGGALRLRTSYGGRAYGPYGGPQGGGGFRDQGPPWMNRPERGGYQGYRGRGDYEGGYRNAGPSFRGPSWHERPEQGGGYGGYRGGGRGGGGFRGGRGPSWQQGGGGGGGDASSRLHEFLKRKYGGGGGRGGGYERREPAPSSYGYSTVADNHDAQQQDRFHHVTTSYMTQTITQYGGASSYYPDRYSGGGGGAGQQASNYYGDYDSSYNTNSNRDWSSSGNYYADRYKL